jgi:hypothetical protein
VKIKISKSYGFIEVDPVDLPGSPPVGRGRTIPEALGDFLIHYQNQLGLQIEVDESAREAELARRAMMILDR